MTQRRPALPHVVPKAGKGAAGRAWADLNSKSHRETRSQLEQLRVRESPQLAVSTRTLLLGVVGLAEAALVRVEAMSQHTQAAGDAAINLARAVERLDAAAAAPETWGGMQVITEAATLIGVVESLCSLAQVGAQAQSRGGGRKPASSKAELIRAMVARDTSATDGDIADAMAYGNKATSHEYVARVARAARKKARP